MDVTLSELGETVEDRGALACCSSRGRRVRCDQVTEQGKINPFSVCSRPGKQKLREPQPMSS